jgi:aspartyl-tRNA(Asn)/glutamyl-tRNA(Gln) amidotransferase subunit A
MDQIGPLARTVRDIAYVLQVMAGPDENDKITLRQKIPNYPEALNGQIKGVKIGVPKEYLNAAKPDVRQSIKSALKTMENLGCICEEVSLPHTQAAVFAYYTLVSVESVFSLGIMDHRLCNYEIDLSIYERRLCFKPDQLGKEAQRRIRYGTKMLINKHDEKHIRQAQHIRNMVKRDFEQLLSRFDLIIGPTVPATAYKIGELIHRPLQMCQDDLLTVGASLAGLPGLSVPCGWINGLPVGMQLIGKAFQEEVLLKVAHHFEQETKFNRFPPLYNTI